MWKDVDRSAIRVDRGTTGQKRPRHRVRSHAKRLLGRRSVHRGFVHQSLGPTAGETDPR